MVQAIFWKIGPLASSGILKTRYSLLLQRAGVVRRCRQLFMKGLSKFGIAIADKLVFDRISVLEMDFGKEKVEGITIPLKVREILSAVGANKIIFETDINEEAVPSRNCYGKKTMGAVAFAIPSQAVLGSLRYLSLKGLPEKGQKVVLDLSRYSGVSSLVSNAMMFEQAFAEISSTDDGVVKVRYVHRKSRPVKNQTEFERLVAPHLDSVTKI